ncbi:MAG: hypothetical protein WD398_09835 [Cyclobacteriaceae bacterium]
MGKQIFKYTKNYCEENIWHLCQHPDLEALDKKVLIISNETKNCPFWQQKSTADLGPVWWDYHVVLLALDSGIWSIYDFDSCLEFPISLVTYLHQTFLLEIFRQEHLPFFKCLPATTYINSFSSDRSHMKDTEGNWIFTPPSWPIIEHGQSHKLEMEEMMDFSLASSQNIIHLDELKATYLIDGNE